MCFFTKWLDVNEILEKQTFKSRVIILYRLNIVYAIYNWYFGGVLLEIADINIETTRNATLWNGTINKTTGRAWLGMFRLLTDDAKHICCC